MLQPRFAIFKVESKRVISLAYMYYLHLVYRHDTFNFHIFAVTRQNKQQQQ